MLYVSYLFLAATASSKRRRGLAVDAAAPIVTVLTSGRSPCPGLGGKTPRGPEWTRRGGAGRPRPSVHRCHPGERPMTAGSGSPLPPAFPRNGFYPGKRAGCGGCLLTPGSAPAAARTARRRPPRGSPPAAPRGQAAFRCRNAQEAPSFGAAPAAKAERPRGTARAPGPAEGPETNIGKLLGPRPDPAARDSLPKEANPAAAS